VNTVKLLYECSLNLLKLLQEVPSKDHREEYIEKINLLLDQREQYIKLLPDEYNKEEKELGKRIIPINAQIQVRLDQFYQEIEQDIKLFNKSKVVSKKYQNPYESTTGDGMYFDKRK